MIIRRGFASLAEIGGGLGVLALLTLTLFATAALLAKLWLGSVAPQTETSLRESAAPSCTT